MMLLIFVAGLTRHFRFVSPVTILQQAILRSSPGSGRHQPPLKPPSKKGQGNHGQLPAKELGKRWRFFPTYVEV
jgi:hypothetical protein